MGATLNRANMPKLRDSSTNMSLLESLIQGRSASQSWPIFVEKYGRLLYRWASRWGAGPHDAGEIMQETLILIFQKLEQYCNQPRSNFRSWLKTVAYRCWVQILEDRKDDRLAALPARMSPNALRLISSDAARDDLISEFDRIARDEILEMACQRVRAQVDERTWACFELTYFEKLTGQQIAERLGIVASTVFSNVCRVRQRLKVEIERLDDSFEI